MVWSSIRSIFCFKKKDPTLAHTRPKRVEMVLDQRAMLQNMFPQLNFVQGLVVL